MNPTVRLAVRLLAGIGLILLVLLSLAAVLFDANDYRAQIKQWALTHTGYQVDIRDIDWNILQPLRLTLSHVRLQLPASEQYAQQPIADINSITLAFGTSGWPSRQLNVAQLDIEQPKLIISDALLAHITAPSSATEPDPSASEATLLPLAAMQLKKLNINHLGMTLDLAQSPAVNINDLSLKIQDWQLIEDHQIQTLNSRLDLQVAIKQVTVNDLAIKDVYLEAHLQNQLVKVEQFSAQYLQGKLTAELDLNLNTPAALTVKQLALANLNIEYNDRLLANFQAKNAGVTPVEKPIETEPSDPEPPHSAWLDSIQLDNINLNNISFTSYQTSLPLTFNHLDLTLQELPILVQGQWLDLSQAAKLETALNVNLRELYYAGTTVSDLVIKSRVKNQKWDFYQVLGNSYNGSFSALFDISLQRYPDVHISQFHAQDLDIGIRPQWLASTNDKPATISDPSPNALLPINSLVIDKLELMNLNLLSYADSLPLSIRGLNLNLDQAQLVKERQLLSIPPQWSQPASFELSVKEALYQGMKADKLRIKGKLNAEFLNADTLQQLVPNTPVIDPEHPAVNVPEKRVIRL